MRDVFVHIGLKGRLRAPWAASSLGTQLSLARLNNISKCFARLDATTKTKILVGFLSIRTRELFITAGTNTDEWESGASTGNSSENGSTLQAAALRVVEQGTETPRS